jgi:dihydrolipoamide dehydrogenase
MTTTVEIKVPDIGDFKDVEVIEVMVAPGDTINAEDLLITLESDKATLEVPASAGGTVDAVLVAVGDKVSEGSTILTLQSSAAPEVATVQPAATQSAATEPVPSQPAPASPPAAEQGDIHAELLVLGSGPGGYTAAFRAADLGLKTVLVERYPSLGGVCLNVGCIPSKALLHAAKVIAETKEMAEHGLKFGPPEVDVDQLRAWKSGVVTRLTGGLGALAKQRKVQVVQGVGRFTGPNQLAVEGEDGTKTLTFDQAVALELDGVPGRLLVIGGGIIGLEMATVFQELGAKITVVELLDSLIPGADKDIVRPLHKRIAQRYENIFLKTKVTAVEAQADGLRVSFEGDKAPDSDLFDRVLVAVGRRPNGLFIGAEHAGVAVDQQGFIAVDRQQRTNVAHIFAIGDLVGQPMLAHKAVHEGKVAAEVAAGRNSSFDARVIPSVAYTDPEVAWVGITETEAKEQGRKVGKGVFPWAASGRSLSLGRDEGLTKVLFDQESEQVIGAGIVGPNAGDLIAEVALAIEMGCDAQDIGLTVHPHPTLSETIAMSAEAFEGTITDLYMPKR